MSIHTLDVPELIERFEELEEELQEAHGDADSDENHVGLFPDWVQGHADTPESSIHDEATEYLALKDLLEDLRGTGGDHEWRKGWYPVTLIADSSFAEYAQELAEDIGAISRDLSWPACHIDWDAAADALKSDYRSVDYEGTEYWYR